MYVDKDIWLGTRTGEKKLGQVRDAKPVRTTSPSGSRTRRVPKLCTHIFLGQN